MRKSAAKVSAVRKVRCAVYTRKSTEEGLDQAFNSLDAQREACEAYIASQGGLGWRLAHGQYKEQDSMRIIFRTAAAAAAMWALVAMPGTAQPSGSGTGSGTRAERTDPCRTSLPQVAAAK